MDQDLLYFIKEQRDKFISEQEKNFENFIDKLSAKQSAAEFFDRNILYIAFTKALIVP